MSAMNSCLNLSRSTSSVTMPRAMNSSIIELKSLLMSARRIAAMFSMTSGVIQPTIPKSTMAILPSSRTKRLPGWGSA
ncbi:hypothetical protein MBAV_004509 [Candidatus Magnetobacterium bavaricum]|uniref:Uncharacterized protein n=1 Tax=Candidatus Magnetobacterium bavaricum TaxID=29290 RepID=A0A0F3GN00_9BACT|nr:hypothetical protein MBAV_004509 [Candidatus Magnetobacterium bavaricum]